MDFLSESQLPIDIVLPASPPVLLIGEVNIEVYWTKDFVSIFYHGFCIFTFATDDKFARNYCLVQLYFTGLFKGR